MAHLARLGLQLGLGSCALAIVVLDSWVFLGAHGFYVHPRYFHVVFWPVLAIGLAAYAWFLFQLRDRATPENEAIPQAKGYRTKEWWGVKVLMPLLLWTLGLYTPLVLGIPRALNALFGESYEATYLVAGTEYRGGRYSSTCQSIRFVELEEYLFGWFCIPEARSQALKPGDAIRVEGSRSRFGITVDRIFYQKRAAIGVVPAKAGTQAGFPPARE